MIAIDESGSIKPLYFDKIIDAIIKIIMALDIKNGKVRIGIITFADNVYVHYDLDAFHNKLDLLFVTEMLRNKYIGGSSYTHKALRYLRTRSFTSMRGDRMQYANFAIIFTDGQSTNRVKTLREAFYLRKSKASVYVFGVGSNINNFEIRGIASSPKRHHVFTSSFIYLPFKVISFLDRLCIGTY